MSTLTTSTRTPVFSHPMNRFNRFSRVSRLAGVALTVLCVGCAGPLSPPPPVDLLPTAPPPLAAAPRAIGPATGSLFSSASYRPAVEDRRARLVGDSVTIIITERVTASQTSSSNLNRKSEMSAGITALPFVSGGALNTLGRAKIGGNSGSTFEGGGGTTSQNTFESDITTTVIDVLPNGHLVVAGEKQIGVNENVDVLRFSGTVDPRALQPGSRVSSSQVANVRVQSRGRGAQSEMQAMGWLARAFNSVSPF
jgi:flagellar L-ring protein precursor FlgH